jgi:hypothetical protein
MSQSYFLTVHRFRVQRSKFLFRSDWVLAASGGTRVKLRLTGTANRLNVDVHFF